ncbi:MAG: PIN domain-containing protein [Pseudomonadota bacterium]
MGKLILRATLIILCSAIGYLIPGYIREASIPRWLGLAGGFLFALLALLLEEIIRKTPLKTTVGATIGMLVGLGIASLISSPITRLSDNSMAQTLIFILIASAFGYVGLVMGSSKQIADLKFPNPARLAGRISRGHGKKDSAKVVDTSAIIDGRLADLCDTGFLEGPLLIPQFILQELRHIADSSDALRRSRARRGLDALSRIQKSAVEVKVVDEDFPQIHEVDSKLIALAVRMQAKIVTNDYNLNKVAKLQGLDILNINDLAAALRPVVLPGETLRVQIVREGKEPGQGVSYLDDGTMVVVENAARLVGKSLEVSVTSVLQTSAGRMIFATPKEAAA